METALRSAVAGWLASDPVLSERVNAIAEGDPGFRVVVTRFLRSRVERRRRNGRAVLLEFAFKLIATE